MFHAPHLSLNTFSILVAIAIFIGIVAATWPLITVGMVAIIASITSIFRAFGALFRAIRTAITEFRRLIGRP